jgi:hypothetical protein
MTWYSRLFEKDRRASRRASHRRRQAINLERLETRVVLSDVTVTYPVGSSGLLIQGDTFNDNFTITELNTGQVTVAPGAPTFKVGVGIIAGSTINLGNSPVTTPNPVTTILVQLPGTNNFDIVNLNSQTGAASPTVTNVTIAAAAPNLTLGVGVTGPGVHNSGALNVSDIATTNVNGVLNATVNNSSFASIAINQFGNGPDPSTVTLFNDVAPGRVSVTLGNANNDAIRLTNDSFGPTTLIEGNGGPAGALPGSSLGNNDLISVTGGKYQTLFAQQKLDGTRNTITINSIQVAFEFSNIPNPAGVTTIQGNGAFDVTTVNAVTTYNAGVLQIPPPNGVSFAAISVTQGNGSVGLPATLTPAVNDQASVTNSVVPGSISILQQDLASNSPMWNSALISGDTVGGLPPAGFPTPIPGFTANLSITQGNAGGTVLKGPIITQGDTANIHNSNATGNASITQGTGINDSAVIDPSVIQGNATIVQNDQAGNPGDTARIAGDTVGGNSSITQGQANNDLAQIVTVGGVGSTGGNASIVQGGGAGDTANIMQTKIGGNASITQGGGNGDVATILGTGTGTSVAATIGGNASITQANGSNDTAVIANLTIGTAGTNLGNISIVQGNGNNDAADINTVADPGGTLKAGPISIGITQGNGNNDIAAITGLTLTGGAIGAPTSIFITQGSGSGDWAEVANVNVPPAAPAIANVTITQNDVAGNASGDTAYVLFTFVGSTSGGTDANGTGNVQINQGNAPGDVALVQNGLANNVSISQGLNVQVFNGSTVASGVAEVDDETVTSNITITQGSDAAGGLYVAAIAFDYIGLAGLGFVPTVPSQFTPVFGPTIGSSPVTAGGDTVIIQTGANNMVLLGDASATGAPMFTTSFLDVFTGNGGGAYVQVLNTMTFGPLLFPFDINGGGPGNTIFIDVFSFFNGVTWDTSAFNGGVH